MNYKVNAVIDIDTCENCKARDGQIIDHLPGQFICTNENGCRCTAEETKELTPSQKDKKSHGGKRQGAGRKPSSTGSTQPIYMGPLEDELRARVMALPPQARKFALVCLVKLALAKTQGEFIVAFRIILREWGRIDRA